MNPLTLATWGLAAFGTYCLYEKSPLKIRMDKAYQGSNAFGRRGSLQEAYMWEMAGHPDQTNTMGLRSRKGSRSRRSRR